MQFLYSRLIWIDFEPFGNGQPQILMGNLKKKTNKKNSIHLTSLKNILAVNDTTQFSVLFHVTSTSWIIRTNNFPSKTLIVLTVNALRLLFFLSHLSFSCSSLRMKVCGTSFSFSWGTWFGSLGYEFPPGSPLLWWRFPPFPQCWHSASTPRCSDPRPILPDGLSH